ncbi:hypothetical protein E2605_07625 [Dysgonomonas capnocytophagoides]|uniref:Phage head morphogenesis domain-containing protein n=1 Tax=Dysgonomonas capnocytophagoides TaxID=45254 RepID=A0A4Y8L6J3_9BACT|nr:hypothetical protein [Dysgonomonas capnocytophagoides]TFD96680.1 hypothetical protein E2605_07625 [Dysgonomonas capnocytophagoides]
MNKYDSQYRNIQIAVIAYLQSLYDGTVDQVLAGLSISALPDKELFSFKDYPKLSQQADKIIDGMSATLLTYINTQISSVWSLSNSKNDSLVDSLFARIKKEPKISFKSHNEKELDVFLNRKVKDLTISDRVWNLNGSFKSEIESAVSAAIEKGQSAKQLARDIKKYLNNPDARFRRIRDKYGNLKPSKKALSYNPGQGVYRSAHANALRLARNEINQAYREADYLRWSQNPGIIAYRIQNSNRVATVCPICKQFNGVVFPKSHKFGGFHISCLCTAIPILVSDEDFERIVRGDRFVPKQPDMPKEYEEYLGV